MSLLTPVRRTVARLAGRRPHFRDLTAAERKQVADEWAARHLADLRALAVRWGVDPAVVDRRPVPFLAWDAETQSYRAGRLPISGRATIPPPPEEEDAQHHRHG
jgi:hypothetical protein